MGFQKLVKSPLLHPFLFAVFPLLFLHFHNAAETPFSEILIPALVTLGGVGCGLLLARLFLKDRFKRGLILSLAVVLFFSYGHVVYLLRDFGLTALSLSLGPNTLVSLVWVLLLIGFGWLIVRAKSELLRLTMVINVTALVLIVTQIISGAGLLLSSSDSSRRTEITVPEQRPDGDLPDIYYIMLDAYAGEEILNKVYRYDNSEFLDFLRARGFRVADSSRSNYCGTLLSLSSTLNLNYLDSLLKLNVRSKNRKPLANLIKHSRVVEFLRKLGYTSIAFSSGLSYTELENVDIRLTGWMSLSEFENIHLSSTPIPQLLKLGKTQYDLHRDRLNYILDKLPEIDEGSAPRFVFAHLIAPHPPFVFGAGGAPVARTRRFNFTDGSSYFLEGGKPEEYRNGYINQVDYLNGRLRLIIDKLLGKNVENPPVIILQADHGPGLGLDWYSLERTEVNERFSILSAIYLPGVSGVPVDHHFTPVNTFRLVFNSYFGTDYDYLPAAHYYSTITEPYDLTPVLKFKRAKHRTPVRLDRIR